MTPEEEAKLLALSARLASAGAWQPACVSAALLAEPSHLCSWELRPVTLRMWLRLDASRSPFVDGSWLSHAEFQIAALRSALSILTGEFISEQCLIETLGAEEIGIVIQGVAEHIKSAFSTVLKMRNPNDKDPIALDGGFGWLLPLYTWLREMGQDHDRALDTPISIAFGMKATSLFCKGWVVDGVSYAHRELNEEVPRG